MFSVIANRPIGRFFCLFAGQDAGKIDESKKILYGIELAQVIFE